jgi:hypothetical protein
LKNKIFLFGIVSMLILLMIPQNTLAINQDVTNSDNEKSEWKTNSFCRISANGKGVVRIYDVAGDVKCPNFWIGFTVKVRLNLYEAYLFTISGRQGSDSNKGWAEVELEGDFFFGLILSDDGGWDKKSYMNGFAIYCRYRITD